MRVDTDRRRLLRKGDLDPLPSLAKLVERLHDEVIDHPQVGFRLSGPSLQAEHCPAAALEVHHPDPAPSSGERVALGRVGRGQALTIEFDPRPLDFQRVRRLLGNALEFTAHLSALEQRRSDLGK
jgi:hypothetical protein